MDDIQKEAFLNLQAGAVDMQDVSGGPKAEGSVEKDNAKKVETMIEEGVQIALEELKEY